MTVTITLQQEGRKGVDFNAKLDSFIDSFKSIGFPYMETNHEIGIFSEDAGRNTKMFLLDGSGFAYNMGTHTVSGRLDSIALGTLGGAYNSDGTFDIGSDGKITGYSAPITFSGLGLSNPAGNRGVVHEIVAELMYLGSTDERGTPTFTKAVMGEAHNVIGSAGNDAYDGTRFGDTVRAGNGNDNIDGGAGNDRVLGDAGRDQLFGGAGNDVLTGGAGRDTLFGGPGKDRYVYNSAAESSAREFDTIRDFEGNDTISLSAIDADTTRNGNQKFVRVDDFSRDAGELTVTVSRGDTILRGDTNGDGRTDFQLVLDNFAKIANNDILL